VDDSAMTDLTYRSPKTEVRASPIHGRGLFAARPIARGEVVAVKGGYVLTRPEWRALEPTLGAAEIQISENLVIAPTRQDHRDGSMLFTNHSCDPNLALQGQIVLVARCGTSRPATSSPSTGRRRTTGTTRCGARAGVRTAAAS
jgi:SET domain-containing protein